MTGHWVAFSVSVEIEGKRGEAEVHKVRRVEDFVLARKGQEDLKRERDESLSIVFEGNLRKLAIVIETCEYLFIQNLIRIMK